MSSKAKVVNPKGSSVATVEQPNMGLPSKVRLQPVTLIDAGLALSEVENLPDEFKDSDRMAGFPPSPQWTQPGQAIFGTFVILRPDVGPNNSRLYELAAFQGKDKPPITVAVWGSAALDRLWDSAYPPVQIGDRVMILFLGEKATQRGLNPVKLFELRVKRASGEKTKLHAS